jgi:Fic family protein
MNPFLASRYVHALPDWPRYRYDLTALTQPLGAVRHRQGVLIGRMEGLGLRHIEEATLESLTDEVQQSSAIEGENLPRDQVRSSLARRLGLDIGGLVASARDVDGVVEMTLDATQKYTAPLVANRLFDWHGALFPTGRSGLQQITVAAWRTGPMDVVSGDLGSDRQRVHYVAPEADRVPQLMDDFLAWFESPDASLDPVLKAAIAHLWFVQIHPFDDGNGRIGRAITDMALTRGDKQPMRFYSMSRQIASDLNTYYRLLDNMGTGTDLEITAWLLWFIGRLDRAVDISLDTADAVLAKAKFWEGVQSLPLSARQRKVLGKLVEGFDGRLTTEKYGKITDTSQDTATRDIHELIELDVLVKAEGGGRSTAYELAPGRFNPPSPL